jgi:hypothetical protein
MVYRLIQSEPVRRWPKWVERAATAWGDPAASSSVNPQLNARRGAFIWGDLKMLSANVLKRAAIPLVSYSRRCHASTTTAARALERFQDGNPDWTETQRMVREATAKICEKYDDDYWLSVDRSGRFPTERRAHLFPLLHRSDFVDFVLIWLRCSDR